MIEDNLHLAEGMRLNLEAEGYKIVHLAHGGDVLDEIRRGLYDLALMDIMLPGIDGLTLCKKIRVEGITTPILFVTARDQQDDKIEGLLAGGDDYITKPFEIKELLVRIQAIFRRVAWLAAEDTGKTYSFDNRSIDFQSLEATTPNGKFSLTRKECMILKYLIERSGEAVSRDQLLDAVWGYDIYPTNRTVDNFIVRLRKIFEENPTKPVYIKTVRGIGYRFMQSPTEPVPRLS